MTDVAFLGSFSLVLTVLPQPGSGWRSPKSKAIPRPLLSSLQRGLEGAVFYNLVEAFHHGRSSQGFIQKQPKAKCGLGNPSEPFDLEPGPMLLSTCGFIPNVMEVTKWQRQPSSPCITSPGPVQLSRSLYCTILTFLQKLLIAWWRPSLLHAAFGTHFLSQSLRASQRGTTISSPDCLSLPSSTPSYGTKNSRTF